MRSSWTFACPSGNTASTSENRLHGAEIWMVSLCKIALMGRSNALATHFQSLLKSAECKVSSCAFVFQEEDILHASAAQIHEQVSTWTKWGMRDKQILTEVKLKMLPWRMEKRINKFRSWLPRKPMKFSNDTLPDLAENESFTARFSRSRIHQWVERQYIDTLERRMHLDTGSLLFVRLVFCWMQFHYPQQRHFLQQRHQKSHRPPHPTAGQIWRG